jgi:modulator of FtsH protease HflK
MPWKGQGGGDGGPWGGGNGQGPWGKGPGGGNRGPQPPNIEELIRRGQEGFRKLLPGGGGRQGVFIIAAVAVVALWLIYDCTYRVEPDELGVVMRFGAYHETTVPGLHFHLPTPIETVLKPKVTVVNRTEIGLVGDSGGRISNRQELPEEALMLTGDENIVDINLTVLWVIKDAQSYLFNIRNPEGTVKSVAEAAIREIVGRTPIASVLAEGRGKVETDTQTLIQSVLDSYGAGLQIQQVQLLKADPPAEVIESFRDVQRAQTDLDTAKNAAEAYHNDVVPRARGEAEQIVQAAGAYQQEVVARAGGDAQRFVSVLNAYRASKDVTAERLYLETMEQILKKANKVLIDKSVGGVVPYLPLPGLAPTRLPQPAPDPAAVAQPSVSPGRAAR